MKKTRLIVAIAFFVSIVSLVYVLYTTRCTKPWDITDPRHWIGCSVTLDIGDTMTYSSITVLNSSSRTVMLNDFPAWVMAIGEGRKPNRKFKIELVDRDSIGTYPIMTEQIVFIPVVSEESLTKDFLIALSYNNALETLFNTRDRSLLIQQGQEFGQHWSSARKGLSWQQDHALNPRSTFNSDIYAAMLWASRRLPQPISLND